MGIICMGPLISIWTFWQTDPGFLAVGRNGRRRNFPSGHPVQRGAMDSSDWSNFGSPSTSPLVDIETKDLEARCPNRWCHRYSSLAVTVWAHSSFLFEVKAFQINTGARRETYHDPIRNLNCVSACNQCQNWRIFAFMKPWWEGCRLSRMAQHPKTGQTMIRGY